LLHRHDWKFKGTVLGNVMFYQGQPMHYGARYECTKCDAKGVVTAGVQFFHPMDGSDLLPKFGWQKVVAKSDKKSWWARHREMIGTLSLSVLAPDVAFGLFHNLSPSATVEPFFPVPFVCSVIFVVSAIGVIWGFEIL